jgi:hypothetical protein
MQLMHSPLNLESMGISKSMNGAFLHLLYFVVIDKSAHTDALRHFSSRFVGRLVVDGPRTLLLTWRIPADLAHSPANLGQAHEVVVWLGVHLAAESSE